MHLLRVRVPDFRVLKNVDIRFEKEFIPRVFPLGSENGGGKSTLLQLIFILLHCSTKPERLPFLRNFLGGFKLARSKDRRILAIVDVWDGEKIVELEFFSCTESYINKKSSVEKFSFSDFNELESAKQIFSMHSDKVKKLRSIIQQLEIRQSQAKGFTKIPDHFKSELLSLGINFDIIEVDFSDPNFLNKIERETERQLLNLHKELEALIQQITIRIDKFISLLKLSNFEYITVYSPGDNNTKKEALLCRVNGLDINFARKFLDELSNKIFLAAPSTQIFLFLPQDSRKSLFRKQNNSKVSVYQENLGEANLKLNGLFTYDFLAVDILIDSFKVVRDKDFKEAIETGEYGSNYKTLLNDLNTLMTNKYVNLTSDFSGITFKLDKPNGDIEIYPEDLSHGELKRLSIYMWLKHLDIKDAIVLMDEVDIALHPDWQFRIVGDLTEWAPSNQYILATHSYELCQALTPSHVKVLEPKLTERRSTQL